MIRTLEDLQRLPEKATIWPRGFAYPVSRTVPGEPAGLEWNAPGETIGHTAREIPLPAVVVYNPWNVIERPDLIMPIEEEAAIPPGFFTPRPTPQFSPVAEHRDPYADCICNHGRHTHANYTGSCGLCDCPYVRQEFPFPDSTAS